MHLVVPSQIIEQPPLLSFSRRNKSNELTVVIASLALGGAERIVLDWTTRIYPLWNVHLIVLRDQQKEWSVPDFARVTRLHNKDVVAKLQQLGKALAKSAHPVCLCHLLRKPERDALAREGVFTVPVLHNAQAGWLENADQLKGDPIAIGVSHACVQDLKGNGWQGYGSVVHHIPPSRDFPKGTRERFRAEWNIPQNAAVIGMIGAVKPQKDYGLALRLLMGVLEKRDVYLVIVGGPVGKHGEKTWAELVREVHSFPGVRQRVALPGFIPDAARCLPAFDMLLNTSEYEGLSLATLEALVNRVPVVAREGGGQGEVAHTGLRIVPRTATWDDWTEAITQALDSKIEKPRWAHFPSYRLWTLAQLAKPVKQTDKVLFITANLNAGGAQRSLVNLAKSLKGKLRFEIAVAGNSTAPYFFRELNKAGITVFRPAESRDAFDQSEMLVKKICSDSIGTVVFWNLDAKIKLLLAKALHFTSIRFVDVSPGDNSFDEVNASSEFQNLISFDSSEFYGRLNGLVLKYNGPFPDACAGKVTVIPNGVAVPAVVKIDYTIKNDTPRIVVSGRITPTKFVLEIIAAMKLLWEKIPTAELHVYGSAEPRHKEYAQSVFDSAKEETGHRIFFHGPDFEIASRLAEFDVYVVLAKEQGCPNALLEALAAGLPSIGNDDGGTKEQIVHRETGLLVKSVSPEELAGSLFEILNDRELAKRLGVTGRKRVEEVFSMQRMSERYLEILGSPSRKPNSAWQRLLSCFTRDNSRRLLPAIFQS